MHDKRQESQKTMRMIDAVLGLMLLQVRGGANDSLSSNTELGQAVQNACEELEALAGLVSHAMSSNTPDRMARVLVSRSYIRCRGRNKNRLQKQMSS